MKNQVAVIVVSDRCAAGVREDRCLPVFRDAFQGTNFRMVVGTIVPDDPVRIEKALREYIGAGYQLIFTTGGTGCAPRDVTPEVTSSLLDRPTPGLDEAIRRFSFGKSPHAVFSRAVSGIAGSSLVVNLPGSPRAVREILEFILPFIEHPLKLIAGRITDCAEETPSHD